MRPLRLRSLGGVLGVVVAIAGGFGAAVGYYSLPDPQAMEVHAHAYARVDQRAIAVWTSQPDPIDGSYTRVSIDASRGAAWGVPEEESPEAGTWFRAERVICSPEGPPNCGQVLSWQGPVADSSFQFDPAMGIASFSGWVPQFIDGQPSGPPCFFDVTWTANPNGMTAPFAGVPNASAHVAPMGSGHNAGAEANNGFAEVSRVAPAQINQAACLFGTTSPTANGFLSQGLRRQITHAGIQPPGE